MQKILQEGRLYPTNVEIRDERPTGLMREVLQNEFRYNFRKGPREISAGTVFTVFTCFIAFNIVIIAPAKTSRGPSENRTEIRFAKPPN